MVPPPPSLPPGSAAGSERYQMGWIQILQPRVGTGLDYSGSARLAPKIQKWQALTILNTELTNFVGYGFCIHADPGRILKYRCILELDPTFHKKINHKRNHVSNQEWTFRTWGVNLIACGCRFEFNFMQILKETMWIRRALNIQMYHLDGCYGNFKGCLNGLLELEV